ncbi:Ribose-phosphate pyrophosphokinase 1, partial [Cladochytrium tenue]
VKIFAGSSHPGLANLIIERLGLQPAPAVVKRATNMELAIDLGVSVRGEDVFLIQSGSATINDHLMELLIMVNACKLADARRITAVIPYFPYMKQSKKKKMRGAISAKLVANMLHVAGVDHVITMDLHATQMQGFFKVPVDNLLAEPAVADYIQSRFPDVSPDNVCIVCKNAGGAKRVTSLADRLKMDFALIHRERHELPNKLGAEAAHMVTTRLTLVGNVRGKVCFLVDDIIYGVDTFLDAAEHLKRCEASRVVLVATHGILTDEAMREIEDCAAVDEIAVTNTYPLPPCAANARPLGLHLHHLHHNPRGFSPVSPTSPHPPGSATAPAAAAANGESSTAAGDSAWTPTKLAVIDVSGVLAEAIRRTHNGESVSYLFSHAV